MALPRNLRAFAEVVLPAPLFQRLSGSPLKRIKARSQRLLELEQQYLAVGSMISAT